MELRLCANIDLKNIDIGENMKTEIIEALALELTKATIDERSKNESAFDVTDAELWVHVYLESLEQIKKGYKEQSTEQSLNNWKNL